METYFVKKNKNGLFWNFEVWKKEWSEVIFSHTTFFLSSKNFFFSRNASKWISQIIVKDLIIKRKIEWINKDE